MNTNIDNVIDSNPFLFKDITDKNINTEFNEEDFVVGDVVCTSELYYDLIKRFGSYENAKKFYEFARSLLVFGEFSEFGIEDSIPYLNFIVYIDQDIMDIGLYDAYTEFWVEKKRYYIGDVVLYSRDGTLDNYEYYRLVSGERKYISEEEYVEHKEDGKYGRDENGDYYIEYPYYSGYFDTEKLINYFDEVDNNGDFLHWKRAVVSEDSNGESNLVLTTSSCLDRVVRSRKDLDDDNNLLPFVLHYNLIDNGGETIRVVDLKHTELKYMCGFVNIKNNNDHVYCDALTKISFSKDVDDEIVFSLDNGDEDSEILIGENVISCRGRKYKLPDTGRISFEYYIDCVITKDDKGKWVIEKDTGVKYKETYYYSLNTKKLSSSIENTGNTFYYVEIGNSLVMTSGKNDMVVGRTINPSVAEITHKQVVSDVFYDVPIFKNESILSVENMKNNINSNIDRGISASFEKHNALGEICTFSDLEHYRNDYFKIS